MRSSMRRKDSILLDSNPDSFHGSDPHRLPLPPGMCCAGVEWVTPVISCQPLPRPGTACTARGPPQSARTRDDTAVVCAARWLFSLAPASAPSARVVAVTLCLSLAGPASGLPARDGRARALRALSAPQKVTVVTSRPPEWRAVLEPLPSLSYALCSCPSAATGCGPVLPVCRGFGALRPMQWLHGPRARAISLLVLLPDLPPSLPHPLPPPIPPPARPPSKADILHLWPSGACLPPLPAPSQPSHVHASACRTLRDSAGSVPAFCSAGHLLWSAGLSPHP